MIKISNIDALKSPTRTKHVGRWIIGATVFGLIGIALIASFVASPSPISVRTATPAYQDLERSISTVGRVAPKQEFLARASFSSLITSIEVHLGQNVTPGQMLVRLKDPYAAPRVATAIADLKANQVTSENIHQGGTQDDRFVLQTDLSRAQTEKASAERALATFKSLQDGGAATEAEVRAAELRLQTANQTLELVTKRTSNRFSEHDIASWSAKVTEAKSNLTAAQASLANVNIASPIAGTVYLIPISSNDFVPTGAELLRVADLSKLEVKASFDEQDIAKLHDGAAAIIHWEGNPQREWHGIIEHAPLAAVMSGSRSVGESIIDITDANGDLPPNTSVTVKVTVERRHHVLTLPREALHTEGHNNFVYRIQNNKLVQTPVQVGLINLDWWEVLQGVSPGDRVALHGEDGRDLNNGASVKALP